MNTKCLSMLSSLQVIRNCVLEDQKSSHFSSSLTCSTLHTTPSHKHSSDIWSKQKSLAKNNDTQFQTFAKLRLHFITDKKFSEFIQNFCIKSWYSSKVQSYSVNCIHKQYRTLLHFQDATGFTIKFPEFSSHRQSLNLSGLCRLSTLLVSQAVVLLALHIAASTKD